MQPKQQKESVAGAAAGEVGGDYVPLPLIGKIREKGFPSNELSSGSSHHWHRFSAPEPRVTPFPVARHRSEGPHWAPPSIQPVHSAADTKEDPEDQDGPRLAYKAQPLAKKKKKVIDISKWKAEKGPKKVSSVVRDSEIDAITSSAQMDIFASQLDKQEDQVVELTSKDDNFAEHRADLATVESSPADSCDYAPSLVQLPVTSMFMRENQITRPSGTLEDISALSEATLEIMSNDQIAEAQQELAERFRPDIIEMLRRRGKEKAGKESKSIGNLAASMAEASVCKSKVGDELGQQPVQSENACDGRLAEAQPSALNASSSAMKGTLGHQFEWEGRCWTERVEAVRKFRFGLDGNYVGADSATALPAAESIDKDSQWKIPSVTERDFLRMEGDPSLHGYTIKEAVALARSMVPAQRSAALRLLSNILNKAMLSLQQSGDGGESFAITFTVDWQAVWAYALGPEPELVLTLRIALDDSHATAVVTCARALEFLLSSPANEHHFNLCESLLPSEYCAFSAPVFKKPFFKETGLIGDCFWKYNVKPADMFPYSKSRQSQVDDTDATVKDDSFVANQDVAAGLIRMGILPRIRFLLEVERLTSAEDSLFAILIALSRHSPAAADAVMRCPRLINTIHELFVLDETCTWSARHKAIRLLKVLSVAKKSNCIEFLNMGVFERSQLGLLHQALTVGTPKGIHAKSSSAELIESLHFWRVCVKYGLCISCFSDYYPALLFWIAAPPTGLPLQENFKEKDAFLAEASFHFLEALANTLPILHDSEDLDKSSSEFSTDIWSWKFAIPIIDSALGWLSLDFVQGCTQKLMQLTNGHELPEVDARIFLRVMSSVLHFLSTVCDRIMKEGNSCSKWLPTFVPKVGLQLISSGMLCFSGAGEHESMILSFAKCSAKLKEKVSEEYFLDLMNCLFGLVRLLKILDRLVASVKDKQSSKACELDDICGVEKILRCGLTLSAKKELYQLLKETGDGLIQKSFGALNKVSDSRRGGPAPGVGMGWGCKGGGHWSHQMLTTQVELVLVHELIDLLSSNGVLSEGDETQPSSISVLQHWRLKVNLSILNLAGPYHRELVEHVYRDSVFRESSVGLYIREAESLVKKWILKLKESNNLQKVENYFSNFYQKVPDTKHILIEHVRSMWLSQNVKHISGEVGGLDMKLAREGTSSKRSSSLSTIPEEKAVVSSTCNKESLSVQWAGQKLPLPSFWFLSPLLSNLGLEMVVENCDAGEVVRNGLILLCGLEGLMDSFLLHIPVAKKIHSLSNIFVMSDDIFLESGVNFMIGALQEKYIDELDFDSKENEVNNEVMENIDMTDQNVPEEIAKKEMRHRLDFEGLVDERYSSFLDKLTSQFASVSYGDLVFSRQVTVYLRRDVPDSLRMRVWKSLEVEHMLEFLPPLGQCCGPSTSYLYPIEESQDLLRAYASSLASGALDRARFRQSVSFSLALFHVAAFIFTKGGDDETRSLRKTFAKNLLLQLAQRSQFQEILLELLNCKVPADTEPILYGVEGSCLSLSINEVKLRCAFLEEACAQYRHLVDKIQQSTKV